MSGPRAGLRFGAVALLGVVAVGVAGWMLGALEPAAPVEPAVVATEGAPPPSSTTTAGAPSARDGATARADPTAAPDLSRQSLPDRTGTHVTGRCIDVSGGPVADALVHLQWVRGGRVETNSATDGTFSLRCEPEGRIAVHLVASGAQHLETVLECGELLAGETRDVGDLKLVPGCVVAGRVVDMLGRPVMGLALHTMPAGEAWRTAPRSGSGTTGDDGAFTLRPVLAAGRWLLRADPREFTAPALFTLGGGPGRHEMLLTLAEQRAPATITGKVVDVAGKGVAGVEVAVRNSEHVAPVASGGDGQFRLVGWDHTGDAKLVLEPTDGAPEDAPALVAWGSKDVQLVWRRGTDVEVTVRRAATGAPVADARVQVARSQRVRGVDLPVTSAGGGLTNAHGVLLLPQRTAGDYLVMAHADQYIPLETPRVPIGGAPAQRVEVVLVPTLQRDLRVQGSNGQALAGVRVELWRRRSDGAAVAEPLTSNQGVRDGWVDGFDVRLGMRVATASTDAQGRCTLAGPSGVPCTLRLLGVAVPPVTRHDVLLESVPEPWVEVVPSGATIEGRLDIIRVWQAMFIRVERTDGDRETFPEGIGAPRFGANGAFALRAVPAGSWRLQLVTQGMGVEHLADVLGLRDGETRRVLVDDRGIHHAEVSGTIRWNGRPFAMLFWLIPIDPQTGTPAFTSKQVVSATADGSFHAQVAAGRYRAAIAHWTGGRGYLPLAEELLLAPGSRSERHLELRSRATRLRLLRRGYPAVGVSACAVAAERFELNFDATDDHGCAEFALPLGVHALFAEPRRPGDARIALGSIEVVAGEGPQIVVVNVPDAVGR